MEVSVFSRKMIENLISDNKFPENTAVISFCDPALKHRYKDYKLVNYNGVCDDVFYVEVDDLDLDVLESKGYTYDTFFPEADEVAEFVYEIYNKNMDLICQCEYGQSRSAGCAAAVLEHFFRSGIWIFANYDYYPSQIIFNKMYDALEKYKSLNM